MGKEPAAPIDWDAIDLVVFDVDGTLYRQDRLRARMLAAMLVEVGRTASLRVPRTLHAFRQCREALGDLQTDFLSRQYALAAARCGGSPQDVRRIVEEWIERRPVRHLRACRYPGIDRLFHALAGAGKTIAIFSDYPATTKLKALGLEADLVISATDPEVARLKPHPAGLQHILSLTGASPHRSLMIGDRMERDGEVARRVGMRALIRSTHFRGYADPPFRPLLDRAARSSRPAARPETADAL